MFDELDDLPLAEADQRILEQIEYHRSQMRDLGRYRASRIAADVARRGHGGAVEVARELGVTPVAVYRLVDEAKKQRT